MNYNYLIFIFIFFLASCSGIKYHYLVPSYEVEKSHQVKRLVVTHNLNLGKKEIGELFLKLSNEYLLNHQDYLVYKTETPVQTDIGNLQKICNQNKKVEGVLFNLFEKFQETSTKIDLKIKSILYNCAYLERVWEVVIEDEYLKKDPTIQTLIDSYSNRIGPYIADYVSPFYRLSNELYFKLPIPLLSPDDINEKIELVTD